MSPYKGDRQLPSRPGQVDWQLAKAKIDIPRRRLPQPWCPRFRGHATMLSLGAVKCDGTLQVT